MLIIVDPQRTEQEYLAESNTGEKRLRNEWKVAGRGRDVTG